VNSKRAAAVYVAVTCLMGRSVLASLTTVVASDPGDPLLNAAILAWNATRMPWTDAWFQFPIFYPTRDALTLSEHLLGLGILATPLYWVSGSAAAAYNLTLLLTYPLAGLAMYALVRALTQSSAAALVAGLLFAFAPYRTGQLPHIQMLALFWAPLALLGLHRFAESHGATARAGERWRWLALFAVAWVLQGSSNGYMLVYFTLLVGAWVLWFLVARRRWAETAFVVGAAAVASIPLLPILYRYLTAQRALGLSRNLGEIASYGADLAALACAPSTLTFWGWLRAGCAPEGELFPGLGLFALTVTAVVCRQPRRRGNAAMSDDESHPYAEAMHDEHGSSRRLRGSAVRGRVQRVALALALAFVGIAASVWVTGPWRIDLGWLRASASSADKPFSTALALLLIAFLLSDRLRLAIVRGSTATFYAGAAVVCWVFAWGPFPRLFDAPILYQAPYAWLLQLPGLDALRVPARFWMMTILCLSVLAGLVIARLVRGWSRRTSAVLISAAACVILLDGWTTIPAAAIPPSPAGVAALRGAPVLVLPAGGVFHDAAVVYHAVTEGWTAINGYSGYEPGYYEALRTLSQSGDEAQLEPFLRRSDIVVIDGGVSRRVAARPPTPRAGEAAGRRLPVTVHEASCDTSESPAAVDGTVDTRWLCGTQTGDHHVTLDLSAPALVHAVVHALGSAGAGFPRALVVETSLDGSTWEPAWEGSPAASVLEAALADPRATRVVLPFAARPARYVRLRQTGRHDTTYWAIAELEVWSVPATNGQ
jgi:hypothetical protein